MSCSASRHWSFHHHWSHSHPLDLQSCETNKEKWWVKCNPLHNLIVIYQNCQIFNLTFSIGRLTALTPHAHSLPKNAHLGWCPGLWCHQCNMSSYLLWKEKSFFFLYFSSLILLFLTEVNLVRANYLSYFTLTKHSITRPSWPLLSTSFLEFARNILPFWTLLSPLTQCCQEITITYVSFCEFYLHKGSSTSHKAPRSHLVGLCDLTWFSLSLTL